jgi:osmotically-inducible protein OsmY
MFHLGRSTPQDAQLASTINLAIHHLGTNIHVIALDGYVRLSGRVGDFEAKQEIDSVVKSVAGVKTLSNEMQIVPIVD